MKFDHDDYVTLGALSDARSVETGGFTLTLKADSDAARAVMAMCATVPVPVEVTTQNGVVIKARATSITERINGIVDVRCDFVAPEPPAAHPPADGPEEPRH